MPSKEKHERIQDPKCSQTRIHGSTSSMSFHKQNPVDSQFRMDEQAWERLWEGSVWSDFLFDFWIKCVRVTEYLEVGYGAFTEWTTDE